MKSDFEKTLEKERARLSQSNNIGEYLREGIGGVFSSLDAYERFDCRVLVYRADGLITCGITLLDAYDAELANVTIYLRDMEDSAILVKQLDLYIPYACSRLIGQLAEKCLLDGNFREYNKLDYYAKKIKGV